MPSCSTLPAASRMPAVSLTTIGSPSRSSRTSMTSRVVPASSDTIATSRRASALSRLDLPTLGGPASTTRKPSRITSPRCPSSRWRTISACSASASVRALPTASLATSASSEKSMAASISAVVREQPLPPALVEPAQRPLGLAQRLAPLRRRLGIDQVGEALDAGEVQLAVLEGATRELAGLRQPAALDPADRLEHGLHHGAAAVHLQLGHVLARSRSWAPANHSARAWSMSSPVAGCLIRLNAAKRGLGRGAAIWSSTAPAAGPETRTTATPARPWPLERAKMVSVAMFSATRYRSCLQGRRSGYLRSIAKVRRFRVIATGFP